MQGSLLLVTTPTCLSLLPYFFAISDCCFDNYLNIFHKTEVHTVILRCWKCLNLLWFKSYDTKCKYIFCTWLTHQMIYGRFTTISSRFSTIYINIFHKTEVQTVILRCWTGLYFNWFKSYDTKCKYFRFLVFVIL